jgi:acid phosphatase family membrane protein YuiD
MNPFSALFSTPWFWSALGGWTIAQTIKMSVDLVRTGRPDLSYFVSTGGMPSAHSALVSALATSIGLTEGFDAPVTIVAVALAGITMFDAAGVRNAAGHQARILNKMLDELFRGHRLSEGRLKELLGHTRLEVFVGMLLGILTAMLIVSLWPGALYCRR